MFSHIFKYRLKCLFRDRETIFWTLLFPLLLATFFNLAFSNLNHHESFQAIDIAVVDNEQYRQDDNFKLVMENVSSGSDKMFNLTLASQEEANRLLNDNKIKGYIVAGKDIKLVVNNSGISQSIIKSFLDNYRQTFSAMASIANNDAAKYHVLFESLRNRQQYIKEVSGTSAEPDNILAYFYSLIAMSCFYGSMFGSREITDIEANITPLASRVNVAPVHKLKTFLYSSTASLLIHFSEMLVLLAYLSFILKVDFGSKAVLVLLATFAGSVAGLSFGALVSAAVKKSEGIKIAILIGSTMTCSALAGMMYQNLKYIIQQNVPVLAWINPINLLTDAFYSLYYYDTLTRFNLNMMGLLVVIVLFSSGTYLLIRRRTYASL